MRRIVSLVGAAALLASLAGPASTAVNVPIDWAVATADKKVLLISPTVVRVTGTVTCTAPGSDINGNGLVEADVGVLLDVTQGKGSGAVGATVSVPGVDGGRCTDAVNLTTTWEIDVTVTWPDPTATWRNGPVQLQAQPYGCAEGWALASPSEISSCGSGPITITSGKVSKR